MAGSCDKDGKSASLIDFSCIIRQVEVPRCVPTEIERPISNANRTWKYYFNINTLYTSSRNSQWNNLIHEEDIESN